MNESAVARRCLRGRSGRLALAVRLLIADLAFTGQTLQEAKLSVLAAAVGASLLSAAFFRLIALLPAPARIHALLGDEQQLIDLTVPVDQEGDHIRGVADAVVTVVEYGDFECPWTQMAAPTARELLAANGDIRDTSRFRDSLPQHPYASRVARDIDSADSSGVAGTPTFFINEHRHDGPQDLSVLSKVIADARAQASAAAFTPECGSARSTAR